MQDLTDADKSDIELVELSERGQETATVEVAEQAGAANEAAGVTVETEAEAGMNSEGAPIDSIQVKLSAEALLTVPFQLSN